jgi:hypothetical protein
MIGGGVNGRCEAVVSVRVREPEGTELELAAVVGAKSGNARGSFLRCGAATACPGRRLGRSYAESRARHRSVRVLWLAVGVELKPAPAHDGTRSSPYIHIPHKGTHVTLAATETIDFVMLTRDRGTLKLIVVATEDLSVEGPAVEQPKSTSAFPG